MNEFLKSLAAFGMEGMNADVETVDAYAGSECAEELIELDNIDATVVAMESMSDAIMEGGLEMQTMALEAAGFTLDTASGFTGELSTESIKNMAKRGYYEVKIQIKKVINKIWKLIIAAMDLIMGSEGRLKSYSKLFKKYNERLSKINPKAGKDGDEKEVTVRNWDSRNVQGQVAVFKGLAGEGGWIRELTNGVKAIDIVAGVNGITGAIMRLGTQFIIQMRSVTTREQRRDMGAALRALRGLTADAAEQFEKDFEDSLKDIDLKDTINEYINDMKEVDSDEYPILTAKSNLLTIGRALEEACKRDMKFKKELIKLKKVWDKKTGEWELKGDEDENTKRFTAAVLRILNKCGVFITGYRMAVSKVYKAVTSNMQGVLADMAKVIAKGTNIGA